MSKKAFTLTHRLPGDVPLKPAFNPVQTAIAEASLRKEYDLVAALKLFVSMPASTGIIANPVRYKATLPCTGTDVSIDVRSFTIRGILFEEDIVVGKADALRIIFCGLFGRLPSLDEQTVLSDGLARNFFGITSLNRLKDLAHFMKAFPKASPDIAMQLRSSMRKAEISNNSLSGGVNTDRDPAELLYEMIDVHIENVAIGASSSWMRRILTEDPEIGASQLASRTADFILQLQSTSQDPFQAAFGLLLGHSPTVEEARILGRMGAIQVHHGSAGSNMVARYLASLHTRSVSDLFTASQMALDSARHFGAISEMSTFVDALQPLPAIQRDEAIRGRMAQGGLPTFGHPEIAAAGRANLELDPRPALYLAPLFEAIDSGAIQVPQNRRQRLEIAQRFYQLALVHGLEKPGKGGGVLRLSPNTDFGAWCVQEALGIAELDRTLVSYAYRGFGWMMDVREQLQERIIRPVIPPDPGIVPKATADTTIIDVISVVHQRLCRQGAF